MKNLITSFVLLLSINAFACTDNQICYGDRVINQSNDIGTVKAIFNNGKVKVRWDNRSYADSFAMADELSSSINCLGGFCRRDRIIDSANDIGSIKEVFRNGKVYIDWQDVSYHNSVTTISKLAHSKVCHRGFCIDTRVIDSSNDIGTILEVFSNGKAKIRWDNRSYHPSFVELGELAISFRCSGKLCIGDRIIDQANDTGMVVEIFNNGMIMIDWDNPSYKNSATHITNLGYQLETCYN